MKKSITLKKILLFSLIMFVINLLPVSVTSATENDDLKVVDYGHGEYRIATTNFSEKSLNRNALSNNSIGDNSINYNSILEIKQLTNNIFEIEDTNEKLLKVSDESFLSVGELKIDVTNEDDMDLLRNSSIGDELKDTIEAISEKYKISPNNDPIITIYSPNLAPQATPNYFYYTGYNGFKYKQEFYTFGVRATDPSTKYYNNGQDAYNAIKATSSFIIDTGIGSTAWGTPYSVFSYLSSILKPIFAPENVKMLSGTKRVITAEESSGEVRFCYIQMNKGNGMEDYLKARSSKSSLKWYEDLYVPNKTRETYIISQPTYTGTSFDNLDRKAYEYRTSLGYFDSVRYNITHSSGATFDLYPTLLD